jgi:hypothetical protein
MRLFETFLMELDDEFIMFKLKSVFSKSIHAISTRASAA